MTAFVNPAIANFDQQLAYGSTPTPHLNDDKTPSSSYQPQPNDFDTAHALSLWGLWPHQHLPSAHLAHNPHSATPRTSYGVANATSTASIGAASTDSSVKGSPLARNVMNNPHQQLPSSIPADDMSQTLFDSAFGMPPPDGAMTDFITAGGIDSLTGFVGEYDYQFHISDFSTASFPSGFAVPSTPFRKNHGTSMQGTMPFENHETLSQSRAFAGERSVSASRDCNRNTTTAAHEASVSFPSAPQTTQLKLNEWHASTQNANHAQRVFFDSPLSMSPQMMTAEPSTSSISSSSPASYKSHFLRQNTANFFAPLQTSCP